ncbi:MAG: hypothetical protein VW274_01920 [Thalassolituus sp.]
MARYTYAALALATSILTGCGAEDQLTFDSRATDIQSCVTGDWTETSTLANELTTNGTISFSNDGYVQVEYVKYNSYFQELYDNVEGNLYKIFFPSSPTEFNYEPYTAHVTVYAWKTQGDVLLLSDLLQSSLVSGDTEDGTLNDARSELEPQSWDINSLVFRGYNVHCDDNFTSEILAAYQKYTENFVLVSEDPLVYLNDYREYQAGGEELSMRRLTTLELEDNGSFTISAEITYPDNPSGNFSGSSSGVYQYGADQIVLTYPGCTSCSEQRLYDRGTILSESAVYMERK